jgi:hypothetical protein
MTRLAARAARGVAVLFAGVVAAATSGATAACGYRSTTAGASGEHLHVALASSSVAGAVATDEVVAGVRAALARAGSLEPGDGYPRCEIEVLRADEASEGIEARPNATGELVPRARATRVGILARAWIVRTRGGPRERDTGDVRAIETLGATGDARTATLAHEDALRAAARRAGRILATSLLGLPAASED